MSPIERAFRRVPAVRWCALQRAKRLRKTRQENAWEYTQPVLVALGNVTISWAGINLILNVFIEAHHNQLGRPIRKDGLPRHFTSKLEYLKKVESSPNWDPARLAEFRDIRIKLSELNEKRISLVHGLLLRRGYGPAFNVHVAKEEGHSLARRELPYSRDDVLAFSTELLEMGGRLSRFFAPLLSHKR